MSAMPIATLAGDTLDFMARLKAENTRDWFTAHKAEYEARVKRPAMLLLEQLVPRLEHLSGAPVKPKQYRIHRDLRFSKDKTPYHTHLHLQWTGMGNPQVAWLFGVSSEYLCAGIGIMGFAPQQLTKWRDGVAGAAGAALAGTIAALAKQGARLDPPPLKRVPPPHPQDHPNADLLKRKGLVLWQDFTRTGLADPETALMAAFERLDPVRTALADMLA